MDTFRWLFIVFIALSMACLSIDAQTLLQTTADDADLFSKFQDAQFKEKTDRELMQEAFKRKRAAYESLMSRETPILFKADFQEIDDETRTFILSGDVEIQKDMFKLNADWVRIYQWSGEIEARGHVVMEFDTDIITGDEIVFNFNTGTGWISNARAAVEPHLYLESDVLEKISDYEKNGQGQYVIYNGSITACSGYKPAWKFKTKYAVLRLENYVHMNNVSAWIRKVPVFWSPYFFYPTKTERTTGLLTPNVNWSTTRGLMYSQDFFLCINDYMDATAGITYYTNIGLQKELQFRNAFSHLSKGEMNFEHIRERNSPSANREPLDRWKGTYEQNAMLPYDIRGTANLIYQSDEAFTSDYGDWNQGITQYLDSRMSLTRYWGTAGIMMDGTYQKNMREFYDDHLQYMPRVEYFTGWKYFFDDFRWQMKLKGENIQKATSEMASIDTGHGQVTERRILKRESLRYSFFASMGYEYNQIPWMSVYPWVSIDERFWSAFKTHDPRFVGDTWATYKVIPKEPEASWEGGLGQVGNGYYRHSFRTGIDLTGPKIYRIFDFLGYKTLSRMKHIIEPKISLDYTPELVGQERLLYFDPEDLLEPGTKLTYSVSTRLLMKMKSKKDQKQKAIDLGKDGKYVSGETDSDEKGSPDGDTFQLQSGSIREFGFLTISQTYDFLKKRRWEEREVLPGQDERIYYPFSNVAVNLTINPLANIYLSGKIEYDPWHDSFSNGYIYGFLKQKDWEFGLRWDYTKYFLNDFYNVHALALEGGISLNDSWSIASWIKYDFSKEYSPYLFLDITYQAQCWGITLHSYYKNNREYDLLKGTYQNDPEIKFGLSFHFKNIDTIDTDTFGKFWWGNSNQK
ncbi:MAG: putative LPS assembly protein LptD [bacterium]